VPGQQPDRFNRVGMRFDQRGFLGDLFGAHS